MIFPFFLFVADTVLWWLVPQVHERLGIALFTDLAFLMAFGVFVWAIYEFEEMALGVDRGDE